MIGRSLPERKKHGNPVRLVCGDTSVKNQCREKGGVGERKKSFVCMQGRSCIINIINKHKHCNHYVISSNDVGDVSKSPGDGDFCRLVLV